MAGGGNKPPTPPRPPDDGPVTPIDARVISPPIVTPSLPAITASPIPDPVVVNTAVEPVTQEFSMVAGHIGDAEPYVFGRCLCDPIVLAADDTGTYLYLDVLWSVGEIDYLESLYYDGTAVGRTDLLGYAEHFEGTATQTASTIMTDLKGSYDALLNKAHSVILMYLGYGLDVKAMIRGVKVYDPRTSTTIYSTNPALALARILTDSGYTMNWASVTTAANYCDELIGGSPGVKRWEIGGQLKQRRDVRSWAQTMAAYCSCYIDMQGSEVYLIPDTPRASNHTLTADNMIDGTVNVYRGGGRDVPDAVTVTGSTVDGEAISYTYGTSGGAGTETRLNMPFLQTGHAIGRQAEETYRKARNNLTLEFVTFDDGIIRTIGDVGTITNAQYGLSSVTMALVEQRQVGNGRWFKRYYQYDANNYSDTIFEVTVNSTALFNPYRPPSGPTPTAVEEIYTEGGVTKTRFVISFLGITWAYLQEYHVTVTPVSDPETSILNTRVAPLGVVTHTTRTTGDVVGGLPYLVQVWVISNVNARGAPGTCEITSGLATNYLVNAGTLTNMHEYILDGDGRYCTTSDKGLYSPEGTGQTWADRFTSSPLGAWTTGETWLGSQTCETVFETEIWDSGSEWGGTWKFTDLSISELGGATRGNFVSLSAEESPLVFTDYSGVTKLATAQYMKAICTVTDSPLSAGDGLHVKLPIPVDFSLGV